MQTPAGPCAGGMRSATRQRRRRQLAAVQTFAGRAAQSASLIQRVEMAGRPTNAHTTTLRMQKVSSSTWLWPSSSTASHTDRLGSVPSNPLDQLQCASSLGAVLAVASPTVCPGQPPLGSRSQARPPTAPPCDQFPEDHIVTPKENTSTFGLGHTSTGRPTTRTATAY